MDPYEKLANAIILLAVRDYRVVLRAERRNPDSKCVTRTVEKLEQFFQSPQYRILTDVEGEYLIKRLREEAA